MLDSRVEEATPVSVGVEPEAPEDLEAEDEKHPLVHLTSSGASELRPEGKVCTVHQGEHGPEAIDLGD